MKRLIFTLFLILGLMLGATVPTQGQKFGEFFVMSTLAQDSIVKPDGTLGVLKYYDTIAKFAEDRDLIYVMYYKYTGESQSYLPPEPKDAAWVYNRYFHLGGQASMPNGFLNGKDIIFPYNDNTVLADGTRWDQKLAESPAFTVTPSVSDVKLVSYPTVQILTMKFKVDGPIDANTHVVAMLTENLPGSKHVFRQLLFDGIYTGDGVECAALFRPSYRFEDCQVTVLVESDLNKEKTVIGAIQVPSVELGFGYSSSGAPQLSLPSMIYPNPVTSELTITSTSELKSVIVYDVTGKRVALKTQKDGVTGFEYKLRTDFPAGVYFVKVNNDAPVKILKL